MSQDEPPHSSVRRAKRESRIKRRDQLAALTHFMSTPNGREYFFDLLASCHVYATSFSGNALSMAFSEGERNVGLRIGADLTEASADLYLQMLKEHGNVRSQTDDADLDGDAGGGSAGLDSD